MEIIRNILRHLISKLRCQRGEVTDDLDAIAQDAIYTADIDDEENPEDIDDSDDEKDDDQDDQKDDDDSVDDDDQKPDESTKKITELETKLDDAQKEINRLGYALRKSKPDDKDDKETPFTREQLFKIFKEHKDNPEVAFQVFEELSKQGTASAEKAAEKAADVKAKQSQVDQVVNALYPDAKKEGSELHSGIQEAVEWAHLDGHPFADTLGLALLFLRDMPETIKHIKEEAKKEFENTSTEDLENKAEAARKKKIAANKASKSGPSDTDKPVSLSPSQLETAKRMGFKTKEQLARYAKILGKKGELIHSEV